MSSFTKRVSRIMTPCIICSKVYTKRGMSRHLKHCRKVRGLLSHTGIHEFKHEREHEREHEVYSRVRKISFIQGFHNYLSKRYNISIPHENLIQEYIGMYLSEEQIRRVKRAEHDNLPTYQERLRESLREIETREYIINPAQMWDILTVELGHFLRRRADFFREQYEIERLMDEHCGLKKKPSVLEIPLEIRPAVRIHDRGLVRDFVSTHISKRQRTE